MLAKLAAFAFLFLVSAAAAAPLDPQAVENADWQSPRGHSVALLVKAQVLLDRARFSPGEIDGRRGDNFRKALTAFTTAHGVAPTGDVSEAAWPILAATSADPILKRYRIEDDDVRGPFTPRIPRRLEAQSELSSLSYRSPREQLAERFHMSEHLLQALNPGETFDKAGDEIVVANVGADESPGKAARIEVDKGPRLLQVFDRDGELLATYPASIGSEEKPAPSGRLFVVGVAHNPTYRYNPRYHFKGVHAKRPFTIKPGPNNPVGIVWIALSRKGYGIHGTPEPGEVSKTQSHGCIRLTNWDALALASAVKKGVPVDFVEPSDGQTDGVANAGR